MPSTWGTPTWGSASPDGSSASGSPPVINSFTGSTVDSTPGASVTLFWNVDDANTLAINQGVGVVSGLSIPVAPQETTTYTLSATNAYGRATASFTIFIRGGAAENIRYHQLRRGDREGDGNKFQMKGDGPDVSGWPSFYDDEQNVNAQEPRGKSLVTQLADQTGGYVPGDILIFNGVGEAKDGGIQVGDIVTVGSQGSWYGQVPRGTANGSNPTFTLDYSLSNPFAILMLNGLGQTPAVQGDPASPPAGLMAVPSSEFSITNWTLTVNNPPKAGEHFYIWYFRKDPLSLAPVVSATITIWTAFSAPGSVPFGYSYANYSLVTSPGAVVRDNVLHARRSDSATIISPPSTLADFTGTTLTCGIDGSLGASGANYLDVYDAYINATLADSSVHTLRPVSWTFTSGSDGSTASWRPLTGYGTGTVIVDSNSNRQMATNTGTSGSSGPIWATSSGNTVDGSITWSFQGAQTSATGQIENPGNAYDADTTPPVTFARFTDALYGGLILGGTFTLIF